MARLGVMTDGLSWFMREVARADETSLMQTIGGKMGHGAASFLLKTNEIKAASRGVATGVERASRQASFEALSIAEKKSYLRRARLGRVPGELGQLAGMGAVTAGVVTAFPGMTTLAVASQWNAIRQKSGSEGPVGYPGSDYNPPARNLGTDGDIVHALHNIHGTGKNRGMT
jgi:hypothetical protein